MNKKIVNVVLVILVLLFIFNWLFAYIAYFKVCNNGEPLMYFNKKTNDNHIIYNELLFKIKVENKINKKVTSLKLFFIE